MDALLGRLFQNHMDLVLSAITSVDILGNNATLYVRDVSDIPKILVALGDYNYKHDVLLHPILGNGIELKSNIPLDWVHVCRE